MLCKNIFASLKVLFLKQKKKKIVCLMFRNDKKKFDNFNLRVFNNK